MKKLLMMVLVMVYGIGQAQELTKNLGDFTSVKVFDQISVTLVKSTENKIVIKGDRREEVELVSSNDELKVRMKFTKLLAGEDIEATLYYSGTIYNVEASEGSYVGSADTFTATAFSISVKSGANVKLKLDVQKLDGKIASGGVAELSGTAGVQDCTVLSGGELKAKGLVTKQTEISVNAGGTANVYATDYVSAKTRAGGNIGIYGNPAQVDKKTVIGGNINLHN